MGLPGVHGVLAFGQDVFAKGYSVTRAQPHRANLGARRPMPNPFRKHG